MTWNLAPFASAVLMLALLPAAVVAQPSGEAPPEAPSNAPQVDVSKLPLNLARVQRQLRASIEREERDGLQLRYNIDVFAETPRIELFTPADNLRYGPVPFSAPTHQDMLNIVTPKEFRSPIMDFSNLLRWWRDRSSDTNTGR